MPVYRAAVVEDDRVGLAVGRPQHPADHLAIEAHLLGRAGEDGAADLGHVPALGQHHAVADDLGFPAGEPRQDGVALVLLGLAVEVLGAHAGAHELVTQMHAVRDVDRERDGLAALAELGASG